MSLKRVAGTYGIAFAVVFGGVGALLLALAALEPSGRAGLAAQRVLAKVPGIGGEFERPDRATMRAYVVSKLSDSRLLELHRRATEEFENHKRAQQQTSRDFWAARERQLRECEANPAEKLRRPHGCYEPLPIGVEAIGMPAIGWETPERFFEEALTGLCRMADTVREARKYGCLPP